MKSVTKLAGFLIILPVMTIAPPALAESDLIEAYRALGGFAPAGEKAPDPLPTGREASQDRLQGFREAIQQAFPMTPAMIKRYREIAAAQERAIHDREEPEGRSSTTLVSLEPGASAPLIRVSPSIVSIISFHDVTGAAWPVTKYVLGNGRDFTADHLGEESNNIVLSPKRNVGFTNLVVLLAGSDRPATFRIRIERDVADHRFDVQVMSKGPNARISTATAPDAVPEAGDGILVSALSATDLPHGAQEVQVGGVDARAWLVEEALVVRSSHPLLSPSWTASLSGPDRLRVYRIPPSSKVLFSVDGRIVQADVDLP
ncbi:MAG: hypothetical protein F4213_08510 [Boseongicola sp. SB0677_bin_26]|nr:hypothetical protein [Boseongicola sp. SB0665_bin_10]MYG26053.1 hypothetical protein [Boseongicola sp. SB0677_bin_26]